MAYAAHMLRIEASTLLRLKHMASLAGLPMAVYMRLLMRQHVKTPLKIEIETREKKKMEGKKTA